MAQLAFVDVESTGLDTDRHEPWEIAVITADSTMLDPEAGLLGCREHTWYVEPDLSVADPGALRVNGFYGRSPTTRNPFKPPYWSDAATAARDVAGLTADAYLVGAVPSFDAAFLDRFLRRHGECPAWRHRLVCVESLAAGRLGVLPAGLRAAAEGLEVPVGDGLHSALADARLARDVFVAVMAGGR